MATTRKVKTVEFAIKDVYPVNMQLNWRDPSGTTYNTDDLKPDIKAFGGLRIPPLYHLRGGKFDRVIRGNRRTTAIGELNAEFPTDTRWQTITADVVEDLTEQEIIDLMVDVGTEKPPEPYEIVRIAFMEYDANPAISYESVTFKLLALLSVYWPMPKKEKHSNDEILTFHHGKVQTILTAAKLPTSGRQLYYDSVKAGKALSWQKKKFAQMAAAHARDMATNPTYGKDNPGPEYTKEFNELTAEIEAAETAGRKTKAVGMLSKDKVQQLHDACPSVAVKMILQYVMQTSPNTNTYQQIVNLIASLESDTVKGKLTQFREGGKPIEKVAA